MTLYRVLALDVDVPDRYELLGRAVATTAETALRKVLSELVDHEHAARYVVVPEYNWSEFAPEIHSQLRLVSLAEAIAEATE